MKIKGVEINFNTIEAFESDNMKVMDKESFDIIIYFISSRRLVFSFDNQQNRDDVIFQIRSKLSKHE